MIRVKNQKAVRRLSQRSLKANFVRNLVAVFAIALTTALFMALFTIAGTMVHTFQQETFRQVGSSAHGAFKYLTLEEKELLEKDPLIKECGGRLMLGKGSGEAFRKVHAELSYMEPAYRKHGFCEPEHGRAPKEGTKEIACDTRILKCVGVKPRVGAEVTVTYEMGGQSQNRTEVTDTFVLSGWWEYDPAAMASMAILPKSYVEEMVEQHPKDEGDDSDYTGTWDLDIVLGSSMHMEEDFLKILHNNGYQSEDASAADYIAIGINWAYVGAQVAANADVGMVAGIAAMLVLIILTGYLIIYNIFQISVSGDIRFYGLLKTIGTTGRQIRRMVRRQALLLSAIGVPIGLALGCLAGVLLVPVVLAAQGVRKAQGAMSPWFFAVAVAFSLVTVLLSCAKPGRIAAKVSPMEAVRYTDATISRKKQRKQKRAKGRPWRMALANIGRNKKKAALVVLSMTLAVVLLQLTYTLVIGFDMDKYLSHSVISDFILGDAAYFRTSSVDTLQAVPQEDIDKIKTEAEKGGKITQDGRIYGHSWNISVFVTEDMYRQKHTWLTEEEMRACIEAESRDDTGRITSNAQLYGMEGYPLSLLDVVDGDLADVYDPDKHAIAAVYEGDDYDSAIPGSQWAKVGDTVTLHYVYEWDYFDYETGEPIPPEDIEGYGRAYTVKEKEYEDIAYEVVACVMVKYAMSYRYYGMFGYVMNAEAFQRDSRTSDVMLYLFNTTQESNASMQVYLEGYTQGVNPNLDFESKQRYAQEFEEFRNMFLLLGGMLSFVVGLVGILNFFNAVLTSIYSRRREFAMLQSIGMTGRQLKKMLVYEGLAYGALAVVASIALSLLLMPVWENVAGGMFWFFTYRFTVLSELFVIPVFAAFGVLLPLACYRHVARQTLVERLREGE